MAAADELRKNNPKEYTRLSVDTMTTHVKAMLEIPKTRL